MSSDLMPNLTHESKNDLFCDNFMNLTLCSSSGNLTHESKNDLFCDNFMNLTLCSSSGGTCTSGTLAQGRVSEEENRAMLLQKPVTTTDFVCTGTLAQGRVSEEEIRALLLQKPVTTTDLVLTYKARLRGPMDKRDFVSMMKRISKAHKRNNQHYVVLRNPIGTSTSSKPASVTPSSGKSSTSTSGSPAQGPVSEEEVRALLLQNAPVISSYLVQKFKDKLKTPEDKRAFSNVLKSICEIKKSNNKNYIVLR